MAGFLLIHGAMHGGWCFDAVAHILRDRGHTVVAPDLPGMGGDEETLRQVTLESWTAFALDQLRALRREIGDAPLVLAGHSRGASTSARRPRPIPRRWTRWSISAR